MKKEKKGKTEKGLRKKKKKYLKYPRVQKKADKERKDLGYHHLPVDRGGDIGT